MSKDDGNRPNDFRFFEYYPHFIFDRLEHTRRRFGFTNYAEWAMELLEKNKKDESKKSIDEAAENASRGGSSGRSSRGL